MDIIAGLRDTNIKWFVSIFKMPDDRICTIIALWNNKFDDSPNITQECTFTKLET
jgi:hypothetical protein